MAGGGRERLRTLALAGGNTVHLQQLVREAKKELIVGGLQDMIQLAKCWNGKDDVVFLLEILHLIDQQQYSEARKLGISAVRQWKNNFIDYNPLQLEVLFLLVEALMQSVVNVEARTCKLESLVLTTGPSERGILFSGYNDVLLLGKGSQLSILELYIEHDIMDEPNVTILDLDLFDDGKDKLLVEQEKFCSLWNSLQLIVQSYEDLPVPHISEIFTTEAEFDSKKQDSASSSSSDDNSGSFVQVGIKKGKKMLKAMELLENLTKKMDMVDEKLHKLQKDVKILHDDFSEVAESVGRSLLLETLRSKFPELRIYCGTGAEEFDYEPVAGVEALAHLCMQLDNFDDTGKAIVKHREIPEKAEIDCVCRLNVPSLVGVGAYYFLGEVTRSKKLCRSASEYVHPEKSSMTASTKFLYKLVQLERGSLAVGGNVIGCALISPSFRKMSEKDKNDLLSNCLSKAVELRFLKKLFDGGNLLLLPS